MCVVPEDDPPLHEALQLADIARPVIGGEQLQNLSREHWLRPVELAGEPDPEVVGEEGDLLTPLPQGRHHDVDDAEQAIEIIAERVGRCHRLEVPDRGREEPNARAYQLTSSGAKELTISQEMDDARLQDERN